MQFNETLTKTGLIQLCEIKLFGDNGYGKISDDPSRMYQFTDRINRAYDRFVFLAMTADGRWQFDDQNYTTYNIATTDIVSGQREYEFALDHLEIEKVLIKLPDGTWKVIDPFDQDDPTANPYLENNTGRTGTPTRYDKRGATIYLDVTPNYNSDEGLKVYFKRGPSYFTYSDNTKVPGFASIFHPYLALHACANYAVDREMSVSKSLYLLLQEEEKAILAFYSDRNKDEKRKMTPAYQDNK